MAEQIIFVTSEKIRIDEFLRINLPEKIGLNQGDASNSKIRRLIISGSVFVNGKSVIRPAFELRGKSTVCVNYEKDKFLFEKQPDDIKFTVTDDAVLFEDENLIFINKPSHFPVEQTITGNRNNLHDAVVDYLWKRNAQLRNPPYVGIMHRLDKDTSGVILFTKNRTINKAVSDMFQAHDFEKKYVALVEKKAGYKIGQKFTVEMLMGRVSGKSQAGKWGQTTQAQGGLYSKTDFSIVKEIKIEGKSCFVVECNLYTGRTHQIRVHLSSKSLPILGDVLYGGCEAKRIYLHAKSLKAVGGEVSFDVCCEPDFL